MTEGTCHIIQTAKDKHNAFLKELGLNLLPWPARQPLAKQAVNKYPPVGASQSSISPAQYTPGRLDNIKQELKSSKTTPPAVLIASSTGLGLLSGTDKCFRQTAKASGLARVSGEQSSYKSPIFTPSTPKRLFRWLDKLRLPRGQRTSERTCSSDLSGSKSSVKLAAPWAKSSRNQAEAA